MKLLKQKCRKPGRQIRLKWCEQLLTSGRKGRNRSESDVWQSDAKREQEAEKKNSLKTLSALEAVSSSTLTLTLQEVSTESGVADKIKKKKNHKISWISGGSF